MAIHPKTKVLLMTSCSQSGFFIKTPLGLWRLKHFIEKAGFACDILDADLQPDEAYLPKVADGDYDIIGMSVSHYNMAADLDKLWKFRQAAQECPKQVLFIAGGQEATLNYAQWLQNGIDLVLSGFAEDTLACLCGRWPEFRCQPLDALVGGMDGVAYIGLNRQLVFHPQKLITPEAFRQYSYRLVLEGEIPYRQYWEKVRSEVSKITFNKKSFVVENIRLFTTSHCPRRCGFCSTQSFLPFSQKSQTRILMLSAEEIHHLILHHIQKFGARGFLFADDDLLVGGKAGIERILKLCQLITRSKQYGEIPPETIFNCQTRVINFLVPGEAHQKKVNQGLLAALVSAGFHTFGLGVETFSNRLLHCPSINKVGISADDCRLVLDAMLKSGLFPQINIILGIPESSIPELLTTIKIAGEYIAAGCQVSETNHLRALPGSPMEQSPHYQVAYTGWRNPQTGQQIKISDYFIPNDPQIAGVLENLDAASLKVLEEIKWRCAWSSALVPRSVNGISKFIAVAIGLGDAPLAAELMALGIHSLNQIDQNDII